MEEQNKDQCRCGEMSSEDEHLCPYKEDVNNDSETLCSCCDYCTQQCAMDI